jgi:hypothetical protein
MLRRSIEQEVNLPALIPIISIAGVAVGEGAQLKTGFWNSKRVVWKAPVKSRRPLQQIKAGLLVLRIRCLPINCH